jgi:hypothetical protein
MQLRVLYNLGEQKLKFRFMSEKPLLQNRVGSMLAADARELEDRRANAP